MKTIAELVAEAPLFADLRSDRLDLIAGCGRNVHFADGEALFREDTPADTFYLLRHGSITLETYVPGRGPITIETLAAGDVVGWSWLFPPYRWYFDARALELVRAVEFDTTCLRDKLDDRSRARLRPDDALRAGAPRAPALDAAPPPRRVWRRPLRLRRPPARGR